MQGLKSHYVNLQGKQIEVRVNLTLRIIIKINRLQLHIKSQIMQLFLQLHGIANFGLCKQNGAKLFTAKIIISLNLWVTPSIYWDLKNSETTVHTLTLLDSFTFIFQLLKHPFGGLSNLCPPPPSENLKDYWRILFACPLWN